MTAQFREDFVQVKGYELVLRSQYPTSDVFLSAYYYEVRQTKLTSIMGKDLAFVGQIQWVCDNVHIHTVAVYDDR